MSIANSGSVGRGKSFDGRNQAARVTLQTNSPMHSYLPALTLTGISKSHEKVANGERVSQTAVGLSGSRR